MKVNPAVNGEEMQPIVEAFHPGTTYTFMRRGGVDSFVEEMPPKYIWRIDEITKKRFKDLDLYQQRNNTKDARGAANTEIYITFTKGKPQNKHS